MINMDEKDVEITPSMEEEINSMGKGEEEDES